MSILVNCSDETNCHSCGAKLVIGDRWFIKGHSYCKKCYRHLRRSRNKKYILLNTHAMISKDTLVARRIPWATWVTFRLAGHRGELT